MEYRVELTAAAERQLLDLPAPTQQRVLAFLGRLPSNPRAGAAKLRASRYGLRRCKVGRDFRVLIAIDDADGLVTVVWIGARRDAYR